ncbi:MAG: hypothetical protein ABMA64_40940 [Myxococcota bacterium]
MSWASVKAWWTATRQRFDHGLETYGWKMFGTYLTLFFGTWFGFWVAISWGFEPSGAVAGAGTVGGAYAATKLTQPVRILATLALTPVVVKVAARFGW